MFNMSDRISAAKRFVDREVQARGRLADRQAVDRMP